MGGDRRTRRAKFWGRAYERKGWEWDIDLRYGEVKIKETVSVGMVS